MNPFNPSNNKPAANDNNNDNRTVSMREEAILHNMLNNVTRDRGTIMRHIAGAAADLRENLHAIHYGITLIQEKFDGQSIDCFNDPEFKNLARKVYGFIQKQTTGRKIFCTTVSSPIYGPKTVYFCHYLTAKTVRPEDIRMMTPFLDSLADDSMPTAEIEIDNEVDNTTKTEPQEPKPIVFQPPKSLPPVPISPIGESVPRTAGLIRQSTNVENKRPTDAYGFWMDNGSNFSEEVEKINATAREDSAAAPETPPPEEPAAGNSIINTLHEIFEGSIPLNNDSHVNLVPQTPPRPSLVSADNANLPQEVLDITPIVTTPAVKSTHRNAKSRLTGRKGSRQNRQQFNQQQPPFQRQQDRRNSFEGLPNGSIRADDSIVLNYTVPLNQNLNRTLDEILTRLTQLENSQNPKPTEKSPAKKVRHFRSKR